MEDSEIVSRCLGGETESFEMLVKKYQAGILSLTWSILKDKEEAKDAAQDAFIQAYLNLGRFDRARSFKNWLYSIASKRCLDRKRKEKSFFKFIKKSAEEEGRKEADGDQKGVENSEAFSSVLSKLNDREKMTVLLKVNEDCSAKEIAEILSCAESSVRVYFFNAKRKLRRFLEKNEDV